MQADAQRLSQSSLFCSTSCPTSLVWGHILHLNTTMNFPRRSAWCVHTGEVTNYTKRFPATEFLHNKGTNALNVTSIKNPSTARPFGVSSASSRVKSFLLFTMCIWTKTQWGQAGVEAASVRAVVQCLWSPPSGISLNPLCAPSRWYLLSPSGSGTEGWSSCIANLRLRPPPCHLSAHTSLKDDREM